MSTRHVASRLGLLALLLPTFAFADGGGMPPPPTSGAPAWSTPTEAKMSKEDADKVHALELYSQAYREVDKAKEDWAEAKQSAASTDPKDVKKVADKNASAQKRLVKARDKFALVTTLDSKNADGWNMLGYTRRKTGDRKGAFDAYWKALALKPEHLGAHEYMGEAYLEEGKINEARAELEWLKKKGNMATLESANLAASIQAWVAANPAAAAAKSGTVSAPGSMDNAAAAGTASPAPVGSAIAAPDSTK